MAKRNRWEVVDLFSGAGGMSYGFHAHPEFVLKAAADGQFGKPSSAPGALDCNSTYQLNFDISPLDVDLGEIAPKDLCDRLGVRNTDILIACSPCTGFSRTLSTNHLNDDHRNSLVAKCGDFVGELRPSIFVMENARELLQGNFRHHFLALSQKLTALGYEVSAKVHMLSAFGLPQRRERAIVVASKVGIQHRTMEDLWKGWSVDPKAITVRRTIEELPNLEAGQTCPEDRFHASPNFTELSLKRLKAIPLDGGSWIDLNRNAKTRQLLTPAMQRYITQGKLGSHPDVYGRMFWDRPAVTIKRECGHTGNGRYAHPEQNRLCSVREMARLQGFPDTFEFAGKSLGNMYRHIGDAVPPLVSYQIANLCAWMLSGKKPALPKCILKDTHLTEDDLIEVEAEQLALFS